MSHKLFDIERKGFLCVAHLSDCWLDENEQPIYFKWKRKNHTNGWKYIGVVVLFLSVYICWNKVLK